MIAQEKIFCIWSGNNTMSDNRRLCLDSIITNSGVKVELINPTSLTKFVQSKYPIHEAYEYLSFTHKADYLRAYLMHHHGGGYCDIKFINFKWTPYFQILNNSNSLFIGYQEMANEHIASDDPSIRNRFFELCGVCHFIMKPYSDFTTQWINELHYILDQKLDLLKEHPGLYHPRAVFGGIHEAIDDQHKDSQYPLQWNEILGKIIHPLMCNYIGQFYNNMPYPNLHSYR